MQKVKAFLQAGMRGAAHVLKFAMQEFWWAAVLAAGMQLLGGGTGGVKGFAETMFFLRALKFPLELLQILKYDFQYYLQAIFEKLHGEAANTPGLWLCRDLQDHGSRD